MSRTTRRGEDYAPAMFPFLAVLLCTIGALVLILVISVVHSHASAKRDTDTELQARVEDAKEQSDYEHSISDELASRREKVKQEIERRQRELANMEDHIQRLQKQMDGLRRQAEAIDASKEPNRPQLDSQGAKMEALQREIDAKRLALAKKIEEQKNRKPAFSIIPYAGPNGTSRRPVYLECRSDGVVIQPEGIRITLQDLKPPFGPGNPLDATLRVLRNAYQQRDATFGLTIPPYPLLVVRPDGIQSYALARAAMSGWDDQFGYELVDADMDLVFPPSIPNLASELNVALEAAKKRQEILIASLPRHMVRARELDNIDFDALSPDGGGMGSSNQSGSDDWGDAPGPSGDTQAKTQPSEREWKMVQELSPGQVSVSNGSGANGSERPSGSPPGSTPSASRPIGNGVATLGQWGGADLSGQYEVVPGQPPTGLNGVPGGRGNGSSTGQNSPGKSSELPAAKPEESWSNPGGNDSFSSKAGAGTTAQSGGPGAQGSNAAAGGGQGSSSSGNPQAGGASGAPKPPSSNAASSSSSGSPASGSMAGGAPMENNDPSQPSTPNISMQWNAPKNKQGDADAGGGSDQESKPIANSRGKGWATTRDDTKATPVSRPIRIVALQNRWYIRKEGSETQFDAEIDLSLGPQDASRQLEKSIRDRVDSWGLSLPGGYWSPSLTVESASDAQRSVDRLQRMLEGSGVEMNVVPLRAPSQTAQPFSPSFKR